MKQVNTGNRPRTRENASEQVTIGFRFASDWLRRLNEFFFNKSQSVVKQNQCNHG